MKKKKKEEEVRARVELVPSLGQVGRLNNKNELNAEPRPIYNQSGQKSQPEQSSE